MTTKVNTLDDVQKTMDALLRGRGSVDETAAALGVAPERLGIYRDFVRAHIDGILDKLYPLLRGLVSAERWAQWRDGYFTDERPSHWELNRCGETFPAWLDAQSDDRRAPFHIALARYEWEEFAVSLHEGVVPSPSEVTQLTVNPTTAVLELPYRMAPFLVANQDPDDPHGKVTLTPETPLPPLHSQAQYTLLFRTGSKRVAFYHGTDDLLFAIKVAHLGWPLDRAAAEVGASLEVAQSSMNQAIEIGLIIAPG